MWARIKAFFISFRDIIEGWLDKWILKIEQPAIEEHGIFKRILTIGGYYKSSTLFLVSAFAISIVLIAMGGVMMRAFWSMFLIFGGLMLIMFQVAKEKRKMIMATIVKHRLFLDIAATIFAIGAVFGGLFGVTISFTWAFTMLGICGLISVIDFFGRSWWGKDYAKEFAWKPDLQKIKTKISATVETVTDVVVVESTPMVPATV